ncbi:cation-transporting ATpase 2 with 8 transmembrane domains [Cryptosporidium sp. chipmunk genotype I]|uniref:cation-transporting ATpase 2 with 8 transmembrane domains n=1 Tax=Cryptosporidium sp. chipmunk genotype I TaxID=1280935 RepID=UPI00351A4CF8|nr:cation-transporting ATpase 2 with 8 transmembrane domains [Cryptosporidium sp. chipmunk genotype I]
MQSKVNVSTKEYVTFGGINNCTVYSVVSQNITVGSKVHEDSHNFDFPVYITPICRRLYFEKVYLIIQIFTLGIVSIIFHWFPNFYRWMNFKASTISECDSFLVITKESYYAIVKKNKFFSSNKNFSNDELNLLKFFNILPSQYKFNDLKGQKNNSNRASIINCNNTQAYHINSQLFNPAIEMTFFTFCGSIYVFDSVLNRFNITIPSLDNNPYSMIRNRFGKLVGSFINNENTDESNNMDSIEYIQEDSTRQNLQKIFGKCSCDIPIVPILDLIKNEILHPFFIFQVCAVCIWFRNSYVEYAIIIILVTIVSLINSVYETRCSHIKMNKMSKLEYKVTILSRNPTSREPCERTVNSSDLLPGDLIILKPGMVLPCDAIILTSNIIVNEAALTGESVPVLKSPIPKYSSELFDLEKDNKHIVYSRTVIMGVQGANNVQGVALVLKIGFSTLQGRFLQAMYCDVLTNRLHYQNDKLYQDSMRFVKFCFFIGIIGSIITAAIGFTIGLEPIVIILRSFDLFTIVAPPALPATIAAGSTVAVSKLKNKKISCSNPSSVNIAGQVNTVVFDKTGTLTSDGLDAVGCISSVTGSIPYLDGLCTSGSQATHLLSQALATCHTVSYIDNEHSQSFGNHYQSENNNQEQSLNSRVIVGEPLEMCMFKFSGWVLCDNYNHSCFQCVNENYECNIEYLTSNNNCNNFRLERTHSESSISDSNQNQINKNAVNDSSSIQVNNNPCNNFEIDVSNTSPENFDFSELPPPRTVRRYFERGEGSHMFGSQEFEELEILKVYEFCSKLRRMTVVCRNPAKPYELLVFCKGSPEQLKSICQPESIPSNLDECVINYSRCGMRILGFAVGYINCPNEDLLSFLETLSRNEAEERLNFIGLMVFANKLRPSTIDVISTLKDANINCIMSTGDHIFTSIAVAQECGIFSSSNSMGPSNKKIVIGDVIGSQSGEECIRWTMMNCNYKNIKVFNSIQEILEKYSLENINWVITGQCLRLLNKLHNMFELEYLDLSNDPEKHPNHNNHTFSFLNYNKQAERFYRQIRNNHQSLPCWVTLRSYTRESSSNRLERIIIDTDDGEEFIKSDYVPYNLDCTRYQRKSNVILESSIGITNELEKSMILNFSTMVSDISLTLRISALEFIIRYCHVYSRMTPEDKAMHINLLQKLKPNPVVGMCGDGNNDILAIQSANIGIAIADHEASVAASFVSNERNIAAVPDIIIEGRAALTSTIQSFQFFVLYIFIQFTSVLYLYSKGTNFTDHQFIWNDVVTFLPISVLATLTKSAKRFPSEIPAYKDILSSNVIVGVVSQCVIQLVFLIINIMLVSRQPGFIPYASGRSFEDNNQNAHLQMCVENTVTFLVSCIQYVATGIAIHKTKPFRLSLITNKLFVFQVLFIIISTIAIILAPNSFLSSLLNIVTLPGSSNYILIISFTLNVLISIVTMNLIIKAVYLKELHSNGPAYFPHFHPLRMPKGKLEWKINPNFI